MVEEQYRTVEEVEKAILKERERLARELHDTVMSEAYSINLFAQAIKLALKAGRKEAVEEGLDELQGSINEMQSNLRLVLLGLRPAILEEVGLAKALQIWLEAVAMRFGLQIEFQADIGYPMSKNVEDALYRIVQEAVNNILKHADAGKVSIDLYTLEQKTYLTVKDDGMGFDLQSLNTAMGNGLHNIRHRAEAIQADFIIDTIVGKGTCLSIIFTNELE